MLSVLNASMLYVDFRKLTFMTYGTRLKEALTDANRSRADLAKHLGMSVQAVGQVITGGRSGDQTFTASNNVKAAAYLGVDAHWLATGEGKALSVRGWPGSRFTLEQIHGWPFELISKVEDFAAGYLSALENPDLAVQNNSNNQFEVDDAGTSSQKLPPQSKQGQMHGPRTSVPASKRAKA
jgi:transcriptional regulator with XRE-family HTH domain